MNYSRLLTALVAILLLFTIACGNDDVVEQSGWRVRNEEALKRYFSDNTYGKLAELTGASDTIAYKILEKGTGRRVLFTDTVNVAYVGKFVNDSVFDTTVGTQYEYIGRTFGVSSGIIAGWRLALQYMNVGDRWQVIIPWNLGYGEKGTKQVPPYSILLFDMQVISIKGE